jgi:hypothetical protein
LLSSSTKTNDNYPDRITPTILVSLYEMGFKLVPLSENNTPVIGWSPIYDNSDYWQKEKFNDSTECSKFKNVASTVGKSHIKGSDNKELFIQVLDIDSEYVHHLITTPIIQLNCGQETKSKVYGFLNESLGLSENEIANLAILDVLKKQTFVTKTRKHHGFHIWWLSHNQNKSILFADCKKGYEFEIKAVKKSGLCTLPPSAHRDDKNFRYSAVGRMDKLLVSDALYDLFIILFEECLRKHDNNKNSNDYSKNICTTIKNRDEKQKDIVFYDLTPQTVQITIDYLLPYYLEGDRHNIAFSFSGTAFHSYLSEKSASSIVEGICDITSDNEKQNRLVTVHSTYKNGNEGDLLQDLLLLLIL